MDRAFPLQTGEAAEQEGSQMNFAYLEAYVSRHRFAAALLVALTLVAFLPPTKGEASEYQLGPMDRLRIRVVEWQPDDPYPRAAFEMWPDEPGAPVGADAIRGIEDRMIALFERIAAARGAEVSGRDIVAGADAAPDAAMWLYALTARLPMGQADRYSVLAAPTVADRVVALREAVETVSALVEFQLSGD